LWPKATISLREYQLETSSRGFWGVGVRRKGSGYWIYLLDSI
jgi:hypothetical protein